MEEENRIAAERSGDDRLLRGNLGMQCSEILVYVEIDSSTRSVREISPGRVPTGIAPRTMPIRYFENSVPSPLPTSHEVWSSRDAAGRTRKSPP
jgi:hypothetical protein